MGESYGYCNKAYIVTKHKFDQIILDIHKIEISNTVKMLIDLLSFVRSIYFYCRINHNSERTPYPITDWAETIVEVFSRKVDTMKIDGLFAFHGYLTHDIANELAQRLPMLGKEIWFDTYVFGTENTKQYTRYMHVIQISQNTDQRLRPEHSSLYRMTIKHSTRTNEEFHD
ncbi:hypothetical protein PMAYCL1PPCAC_19737 [Pristionchus mayeri]|uniref:Uncharacterized protein n=1 Tax=Pristionchus mayeri TaxID=1317129 RepID=A0AAN5I2G9_9BILA|nr:hypothetical protein PMAYCL1PPCAC_19737 [Pristionchus mayeri]